MVLNTNIESINWCNLKLTPTPWTNMFNLLGDTYPVYPRQKSTFTKYPFWPVKGAIENGLVQPTTMFAYDVLRDVGDFMRVSRFWWRNHSTGVFSCVKNGHQCHQSANLYNKNVINIHQDSPTFFANKYYFSKPPGREWQCDLDLSVILSHFQGKIITFRTRFSDEIENQDI